MAKIDFMSLLRAQDKSPLEFKFDNLMCPPIPFFIPIFELWNLDRIVTDPRNTGKIKKKYALIDAIMHKYNFKNFHRGTNRIVYTHLGDPTIVAKVAFSKVGKADNLSEYQNQFLLKPFVTKMFHVSPCGILALSERVQPISSLIEFEQLAEDIFDVMTNYIIGKFVLEDVGTKFFMNWGMREGFGPCLLDYPYVFELDDRKLICIGLVNDANGQRVPCNGEIDYNDGFNELKCCKCGRRYFARELESTFKNNIQIVESEGEEMQVRVTYGNKVFADSHPGTKFARNFRKRSKPVMEVFNTPVAVVKKGNLTKSDELNNNFDIEFSFVGVHKEKEEITRGAIIEKIVDSELPSSLTILEIGDEDMQEKQKQEPVQVHQPDVDIDFVFKSIPQQAYKSEPCVITVELDEFPITFKKHDVVEKEPTPVVIEIEKQEPVETVNTDEIDISFTVTTNPPELQEKIDRVANNILPIVQEDVINNIDEEQPEVVETTLQSFDIPNRNNRVYKDPIQEYVQQPSVEAVVTETPNDGVRDTLFDWASDFMDECKSGRIKLFRITKRDLKNYFMKRIVGIEQLLIPNTLNANDARDQVDKELTSFIDENFEIIVDIEDNNKPIELDSRY